jgi:hypothetical protein
VLRPWRRSMALDIRASEPKIRFREWGFPASVCVCDHEVAERAAASRVRVARAAHAIRTSASASECEHAGCQLAPSMQCVNTSTLHYKIASSLKHVTPSQYIVALS